MEANTCIVNELLKGKRNYEKWSIQVQTYLWSRDLWNAVNPDHPHKDEEAPSSDQSNAVALHAILISCDTVPFKVIKSIRSARLAWSALLLKYGPKPEENEEEGIPSLSDDSSSETNVEQPKLFPTPRMNDYCQNSLEQAVNEGQNLNVVIKAYDGDIRPYLGLFEAVCRGDWEKAQEFLDQHSEGVRVAIGGKNLLHVAVAGEHLHIVEKLVERMSDEEIEMRRGDDHLTPLDAAIQTGNLPIAQCLIRRHRKLVTIVTRPDGLPVFNSINCHSHKLISYYLYSVTPIEDLKSTDGGIHLTALLWQCINAKLYDMALDLLKRAPEVAVKENLLHISPLLALASANVFVADVSSLMFWQRWIYKCIHITSSAMNHISIDIQKLEDNKSDKEDTNVDKAMDSFFIAGRKCSGLLGWMISIPLKLLDIKVIYQLKLVHAQTREILRCMCEAIRTSSNQTLQNAGLIYAMIRAAQNGNVEFITGIAKVNPEFTWSPSISRRVIEAGIKFRQPKTFSLVHGLANKVAIGSSKNSEDQSNMLHKVAIIASPRLLNCIPGAVLQMQRELQWFKEVQTIVSLEATSAVTNAYPDPTVPQSIKVFLTAREIFTKTHKELIKEGEKWMKGTASSCSVVGSLIVTVTFAAAFTFPGGNEQTKGYPMFSEKLLFRIFMISVAIALSLSTTSVLMFLGILTSRYAEEDFHTSLPRKLIIGLSTLFFSIVAMLTAFCVGISLMFHHELWIVIPSALLASIPVTWFVAIQFPLLFEMIMSTYGPNIFDKKTQRWI